MKEIPELMLFEALLGKHIYKQLIKTVSYLIQREVKKVKEEK